MTNSSEILNRKLYRELKARENAEKLLEEKSLELYKANEELKKVNYQLKNLVDDKTSQLTEKEFEYKTLVESISDIICRTELDGTITFVNPVVYEITGYRPEELLGKNVLDFIVPEYKGLASRYFIRKYVEKNCLSYNEFEIISKTSKRIWVGINVQFIQEKCHTCTNRLCALASSKPELASGQNCVFKEVVIVARNITRQKQTEDLLIRQSRNLEAGFKQQEILSEIAVQLNKLEDFSEKMSNFLQTIGEHLNVSRVYIFEDNEDGVTTSNTYEWCNDGVTSQIEELQGIPYEMIPSWKKILNEKGLVYSENISELPADLREILEPQDIKSIIVYPLFVQSFFFGFIGFDECTREKKWLRSELELLKTLSGMLSNAYERKISEKHLKESEEKNNAILNSIPDVLLHFNKDGTILGYHSVSNKDLALPSQEFLGNKITEIFPGNFGKNFLNALSQCLTKNSYKFNYELEIRGKNQYYESRMSKMNKNEVIAVVRNVSERIHYVNALTKERDKANMANKAKSEFLANMSHEFRTPMNAILGFSEALYQRVKDPQNKRMLKSVLNSGNLLLSLINDILDLSKIEADKLEIKPQPTDLKSVLDEIALLFKTKATQKEIPINIDIDKDFPDSVLIDEIRIKQIIFNLVGNALKFTNKGFVNICLRFSKTSDFKGTIILTVEDTGIGIPESELQSIFDAFRQQSGQSNRKYEGTGLGLSISKRLTEKMGGGLSLKSEVNKGSVFKLELPDVLVTKHYNNSESSLEEVSVNVKFTNSTLMVVDDIPINIELIKKLLMGKGLEIVAAEDGETALSLINQFKPDLILLDVLMPGMNGFDVASRIRKNPSQKNIPIIAFTASPEVIQNYESDNLFDSIIYKPIKKDKLCTELKKYLKYEIIEAGVERETDIFTIPKELPKSIIDRLPDIEEAIENKILPMWYKVKDTFVLYRIEEFINEIQELGIQYNFSFLTTYAIRLKEDMEIVDLESLKINLEKFSAIVENLKNYNNNNF